jgi:subtilase family serine protease
VSTLVRRAATAGVPLAAATLAALTAAPAVGSSAVTAARHRSNPSTASATRVARAVPMLEVAGPPFPTPPSIAECKANRNGRSCYGPHQLTRAYDVDSLHQRGITGKGVTIAIVDSFGSPTAQSDLKTFDRAFGLPDPPSFRVITPAGKPPPFNPNDAGMVGWAQETSLDVQMAHAMAPGANILLVETPVAETEGTVGLPQIVQAENYVINNGLADVISQSFGASEPTFPSKQSVLNLRSAFINAANHNVTVLASSGDSGSTDYVFDTSTYFHHRTNSWPSSDPLVTSVGGTELHLNQFGGRIAPDSVWNQTAYYGDAVAGGGGTSMYFSRPAYQNSVAGQVGAHRGTPDISLSSSTNGGAIIYLGFNSPLSPNGYWVFGGTSEASPTFAGIVALADQAAGHRLGLLNPALYRFANRPALPDIRKGNNTVSFIDPKTNKTVTVPGWNAVAGYDLASGLGTVNAAALVQSLR